MSYAKFLNSVSLSRKPSPIRILTALKAQSGPSMISLAGGNPNPLLFPFKEASFKLKNGKTLNISEERMKVALQYDASPGNINFVKTLKKLQDHYHKPPLFESSDPERVTDVCVTYGSTDGLAKSFDMLVCPGDKVLVEEPVSPMILSALKPLGCDVLPVETNRDGIIPESLSALLQTHAADNNSCKPKFLYTIPNGQIPSGVTTSVERRKEIYKIARQFDFLILEHDPLYFLQYSSPRKPSYLSIDEDGRVLRFDSFSMILSPGMRVGFVTGPNALIDRIVLHLMVSSMHVPTFPQILINEFLIEIGREGFEDYVSKLSDSYQVKRDAALESASKWLQDSANWNIPEAGVCLWLKLKKSSKGIVEKLFHDDVYFASGNEFSIIPGKFDHHLLATFSYVNADGIDEGFQKLAAKLK